MLSSINILSTLNEKLTEQQKQLLDLIEPYTEVLTLGSSLADFSYGDTPEIVLPFDQLTAVTDLLNVCDGRTLIMEDGYCVSLVGTTVVYETYTQITYTDSLHDDVVIMDIFYDNPGHGEPVYTFVLRFNGWNPSEHGYETDNFSYPFTGYLESESVCSSVITAISLCAKGQLRASEFIASMQSAGISMTANVSTVVNTITRYVSGSTAYLQADGLVQAIRDLYSAADPNNISAEDDKINFHTTDFTISSSVLLSPETVFQAIGSVVGLIVSFWQPIIGAIVSIGSGLIAGIWQTLNQSKLGNSWIMSELGELDNESFAIPIISGTYSTNKTYSPIPGSIIDYTKKYGYLRSENALFLMYSWIDPYYQGQIHVEVFPNVNVNYRNNWDTGLNLMFQHVIDGSHSGNNVNIYLYDPALEHTNFSNWFQGDSFSPADGPKVQFPTPDKTLIDHYQDRAITYSFMNHLAFVCYRLLYCRYQQSGSGGVGVYTQFATIDDWYSLNNIDFESSSVDESYCVSILADFLWWMHDCSQAGVITSWANNYMKENWNEITYGAVMNVYKAILKLRQLNATYYSTAFTKDFFTIFSDVLTMGDDSNYRNFVGMGKYWSTCPHLCYTSNMFIYPPENKYSLTTKIIATSIVIAAIATVTIVAGVKIRKRILYKSQQAQRNLDTLKKQYQSSGSYADYNEFYKASKKYNRTYGLLTGTSYDMSNSWYNDTKSIASASSSNDLLPSLVNSNEEGKLSVDLTEATDLIQEGINLIR